MSAPPRRPAIPPECVAISHSDGYAAAAYYWPAREESQPTAILYFHGIQSHGGWYEWSAAHLAQHSATAVLMPDRRGSGRNAIARGDTPGMPRWFDDVDEHVAWLRARTGARKVACVGVSWGGKLALAAALRQPQVVDHVLLIAPGLFPQVDVGIWERVRIGGSLLVGGSRRHAIPLDDPALFTANPAGQAFIAADNLKLTEVTARFLYESSRLDRLLVRTPPGGLAAKVTLVLAGADRIIRNAATERWARRVTAEAASVQTIPGAAHTLEFEACGDAFAAVLSAWSESVTASA